MIAVSVSLFNLAIGSFCHLDWGSFASSKLEKPCAAVLVCVESWLSHSPALITKHLCKCLHAFTAVNRGKAYLEPNLADSAW